jgi:hypothetical protein
LPTTIEEAHSDLAVARAKASHVHFRFTVADLRAATFTKAKQLAVTAAILSALSHTLTGDMVSAISATDLAVASNTHNDGESLVVAMVLDAHSMYAANVFEAEIQSVGFASKLTQELVQRQFTVREQDLALSIVALATPAPSTAFPTAFPTSFGDDKEREAARREHSNVHFHLTLTDTTFISLAQTQVVSDAIVHALHQPHLGLGEIRFSMKPADCTVISTVSTGSEKQDLVIQFVLDAHDMYSRSIIEAVIKTEPYEAAVAQELRENGISVPTAKSLAISMEKEVVPNVQKHKAPTFAPTDGLDRAGKGDNGSSLGSTLRTLFVMILVASGVVAVAVVIKKRFDAGTQENMDGEARSLIHDSKQSASLSSSSQSPQSAVGGAV